MPEFKQDAHKTPVLFRVSRAPKKYGRDVTAVFPCEPADTIGLHMSCYVHIGQHGSCTLSWYHTTRPATPAEYADLKRELESAPYGYRLKVCRRITAEMRKTFHREVKRLRAL